MDVTIERFERATARCARRLLQRAQRTPAAPGARLTVLALRYYHSELDLIPDVIPGIGLLDDLALLSAVCWLYDVPDDDPTPADPEAIQADVARWLASGRG